MEFELAETLVQVLEEDGIDGIDVSIRESYSGRSMFGKETVGVVINGGGVLDALIAVINNATCFVTEEDEPVDFYDLEERFTVRNMRMDSMGKGIILY